MHTFNAVTLYYRIMMNYHNRVFRSAESSSAAPYSLLQVTFRQIGKVIIGEFSSESIQYGQLLGEFTEYGILQLYYHHVDNLGATEQGQCQVFPETTHQKNLTVRIKWKSTHPESRTSESQLIERASSRH